ncbi:DASS family sodium-coupled anion symporter [Candidatus Formimonas warabiya]|uniref:DASS family sodium-coupled anion symporter n=1 Tax=Formimonas warabiya TaxID=1761012 RepID=UPI001BE4A659|nr:DASS family sodium-coupled anion symporter [Candidatus Formimonas warabiya]
MSQQSEVTLQKGSGPVVTTLRSKWWKVVLVFGLPILIWFVDAPPGLTPEAWHIFAIYAGAILGVIFKPFPEPVVLLAACSIAGIVFSDYKIALSGFSNRTAWLVFSAFLIGQAFVDTNLGKRISYLLLKRFGKSSLAIGYCMALSDLIVSPATPSNTARSGGIVYPIFKSLAVALGSVPGPTAKKIGAYLTALEYQNSLTSHAMFITAGASNAVVLAFAVSILNIEVSWALWFLAAAVPCLLVFFLMPWLVYKVYPPELKAIPESKAIATQGLQELGPMTKEEKYLAFFFLMAILGWATTSITKIDTTIVAISFVSLCLLFGAVKWESLAGNKGAWTTFIWYAGVLGIAATLSDAKFFEWLADVMGKVLPLAGLNPLLVLTVLTILSILPRYLFASTAAFAASFYPVLFAMALAAKIDPMATTLLLSLSLSYGSTLAPYTNAVGPILAGTGYVADSGVWWKLGGLLAIAGTIALLVIGLPYWKLLGLW